MSRIAELLRRAKQLEAAAVTSPPAASSPATDGWVPGAHLRVERGVDVLTGRFAFQDGDWIHWVEDNGAAHATPSRFVMRTTP